MERSFWNRGFQSLTRTPPLQKVPPSSRSSHPRPLGEGRGGVGLNAHLCPHHVIVWRSLLTCDPPAVIARRPCPMADRARTTLGGAARRAQGPLVLLVPRCSTWSRLVPLLPLLPLVHLVLPCPAWSHLLPLVHLVLLVLPCPAWSHLVCLAPLCADAQALCGLSRVVCHVQRLDLLGTLWFGHCLCVATCPRAPGERAARATSTHRPRRPFRGVEGAGRV